MDEDNIRPVAAASALLEVQIDKRNRPVPLTKVQAWNLYMSHTLSTWNARTYEFAAILFTASAFPDTLLASSVRLMVTIIVNRATVILACMGWGFLVDNGATIPERQKRGILEGFNPQYVLFGIAILLGIGEKLSGTGNTISMERDWVPVLASKEEHADYSLTHLNAVMRRIDLVCKLVAPLVISIVIASTSTRVGVLVVAGMSATSWGIELWSARRVWNTCIQLRAPKVINSGGREERTDIRHSPRLWIIRLWRSQAVQLRDYFSANVWIPSMCLSMLHANVLTYSATFITYLLNTGFSLLLITVTRTLSSFVEVSSTFVAPIGIKHLAVPVKTRCGIDEEEVPFIEEQVEGTAEKEHGVGLERSGLWGISLQLFSLIPVVIVVFQITPAASIPGPLSTFLSRYLQTSEQTSASFSTILSNPISLTLPTIAMFAFLATSRLGLWTFDLTTQEITQTRAPPSMRSSFAGTEASFVALFEILQWTFAAAYSDPEQFKWLALGSLGVVGLAAAGYAGWVRWRRGHLVHWEKVGCGCQKLDGG
ncbi:MAG: hypothetical protein MMC33_007624 [Icmadophila ericetorum]|nr:hypothetical protein [Icmadophila ericetorum]